MYDDAPRARRRGGLATALALIGCAVLGTAGAYAYRSYSAVPTCDAAAAGHHAPTIRRPTKIVPAPAGDPQSSKADPGSARRPPTRNSWSRKQEEPVALKDLGTAIRAARRAPGARSAAGPGRRSGAAATGRRRRLERAEEGPHRHHSPRRQRRERPARSASLPPAAQAPAATRRPRPRPRRARATGAARAQRRRRRSRSTRRPSEPAAPRRPSAPAARTAAPHRAVGAESAAADSWCSCPRRRARARRNPPSAACRPSSPTSLAAGSRSSGAPIWAAKGVFYRDHGWPVCIRAGGEPVLRELQGRRRPVRRSTN